MIKTTARALAAAPLALLPLAATAPHTPPRPSAPRRHRNLPQAAESRDGYERTKFKHCIDKDKDSCNTRAEVLLAEAWDSGASQWTAARRQAYANDLGAERSLVAVTAKSNRSKADQDPAQ